MADSIPPSLFNSLGDIRAKRRLSATIENVIPTISREDVERKIKTRYFAKYTAQRNGNIYEITGGQYSSIENNPLFRKTSIDWIIRGKLEDTILTLGNG